MSEGKLQWKDAEIIFHSALEKDGEERERFVRERCQGDDALRQAVQRLLAFDTTAEFDPAQAVAAHGSDWTGTQIGPYRILSLLGSGGMGSVYKAERQDSFRKIVALKLLRFDLGDEPGRLRFRRERQILALLEHPNIARLLDGGNMPDGSPYLVMEYVEGVPLTTFTGDLPVAARLEVFRKVCDGVQYAHQRLIVHRDLKPGNILVQADGTPKLLDFGIAKLIEPSSEAEALPQTVTRIMTPEYASPEQIRGEPVSTSTDIYALGCVLYEVLTGQRAHRFPSRDPLEIARVVCESEPPQPSSAGPRFLRGDLDNIVLKALRKDPTRRYGSATQLSDDLGRYLEGRTVMARPDTVGYRLRKYVRRNRWGLVAVTAVVLALSAGLIAAQRQARIAETRFAQVRTLANRLLFDVYDSVVTLPGSLRTRQLVVDTALEYLNSLARDAAHDPELAWEVAEAYTRVADVQGLNGINRGQRREAVETAIKALALQESLLTRELLNDSQKESMVRTYVSLVPWQIFLDRPAARATAGKAIALTSGLSPLARGGALRCVGLVQAADGKLDEAVKSYDESIRLLRRSLTENSAARDWRSAQSSLNLRGRALILLGRLDEAVSSLQESRSIGERLVARDPSNPQLKMALSNDYEMLATVLGLPDRPNLGRPAEGIAMLDRSLRLLEEQRRIEPTSGELIRQEGILWGKRATMQRDPKQALATLEKCGQLIPSINDAHERSEMYASYLSDKARYLLALGRMAEVRETLKAMCADGEEHVRREPSDTVALRTWGESLASAAQFELEHGSPEAGRAGLERAVDLLRQADERVPGDPRFLNARADASRLLARYWTRYGDPTRAAAIRTEMQALVDARAAQFPGSKAIRAIADKYRAARR